MLVLAPVHAGEIKNQVCFKCTVVEHASQSGKVMSRIMLALGGVKM